MKASFFLLILLLAIGCYAEEKMKVNFMKCATSERLECAVIGNEKPSPVWVHFFKKQNQRKKVIASALAFPLPCGFLGLHRVYLGTKPYIPVIYVGTIGGCVGLLPLIDFFNLVCNRDISRFQANPHIFMWVDNEKKNK